MKTMKRKQGHVPKEATVANKRQARATETQIDAMVDYFVQHPHIATGKFKTLHGHQDLQGSWEELAALLNAKFADGKKKDVESWKTTWRDNKTKVSTKFIALKNLRKKTGNNPVDIKLTERDTKIIGLLGFDYMEGLQTVPDSFPEEHDNINEQLMEGDQSALEIAPKTVTVRPVAVTVTHDSEEIDNIPASENFVEEDIDTFVLPLETNEHQLLGEFIVSETELGPINTEELLPAHSNEHTEPQPGPRTSSNVNKGRASTVVKRSVAPTSRSRFLRKGVQYERLGVQLQDARIEFGDLAQRTSEATELMAQAEMKRAEAALIMATNDRTRVEILRTMAENDKARNEVLIRLVGILDVIHSNLNR